MPLFRHSNDDQDDPDAAGDVEAKLPAILARLQGMTLAERAAELLPIITAKIDQPIASGKFGGIEGPRREMDHLLAGLWPENVSDEYYEAWDAIRHRWHEAFQALVLSRLVFPLDYKNQWATVVFYFVSADGREALSRGDVADVVARRLPD